VKAKKYDSVDVAGAWRSRILTRAGKKMPPARRARFEYLDSLRYYSHVAYALSSTLTIPELQFALEKEAAARLVELKQAGRRHVPDIGSDTEPKYTGLGVAMFPEAGLKYRDLRFWFRVGAPLDGAHALVISAASEGGTPMEDVGAVPLIRRITSDDYRELTPEQMILTHTLKWRTGPTTFDPVDMAAALRWVSAGKNPPRVWSSGGILLFASRDLFMHVGGVSMIDKDVMEASRWAAIVPDVLAMGRPWG
jgi:hypothetical protein